MVNLFVNSTAALTWLLSSADGTWVAKWLCEDYKHRQRITLPIQ